MNQASIGIIGGADGPTSILIAGPSITWLNIAGIVLVLAAVVGAAVVVYKKRKSK